MNKEYLVISTVIIASVLILSGCSKSDKKNDNNNASSPMQEKSDSVAKETKTHIKKSDVYEAKDGEKEVVIEEFKLTLISAKVMEKEFKSPHRDITADGHFVEVISKIHQTRASDEKYLRNDINGQNFQLVDDKGNTFDSELYEGTAQKPAHGLTHLSDGEAETFDLFFDVPDDAKNLKLKFFTSIPGGYDENGDEVEIIDSGLISLGI